MRKRSGRSWKRRCDRNKKPNSKPSSKKWNERKRSACARLKSRTSSPKSANEENSNNR